MMCVPTAWWTPLMTKRITTMVTAMSSHNHNIRLPTPRRLNWNVHRFVCRIETLNEKDYLELKNKSNNGLERENKEMNKIFPKKPTLLGFVSGIKERSCEFVNMNELISKGLGSRPPHQTPKVFPIPDDYVNGPIVPYQMVKDGVKYTPLVGAVTADA